MQNGHESSTKSRVDTIYLPSCYSSIALLKQIEKLTASDSREAHGWEQALDSSRTIQIDKAWQL